MSAGADGRSRSMASRMMQQWATVRWPALALLVALTVIGCETPSGRMNATAFPPDLSYIPPAQIRTAMWVLAAEIQELERLLSDPEELEGQRGLDRSFEVRATLERMRVAAQSLDRPGRSNQHPVLNENLELFLRRLERAERAVDRDPPDYYPASTIAGSCYLCHGQTKSVASLSRKPNRIRFAER